MNEVETLLVLKEILPDDMILKICGGRGSKTELQKRINAIQSAKRIIEKVIAAPLTLDEVYERSCQKIWVTNPETGQHPGWLYGSDLLNMLIVPEDYGVWWVAYRDEPKSEEIKTYGIKQGTTIRQTVHHPIGSVGAFLDKKEDIYQAKRIDSAEWVKGTYTVYVKDGQGHHFIHVKELDKSFEIDWKTASLITEEDR